MIYYLLYSTSLFFSLFDLLERSFSKKFIFYILFFMVLAIFIGFRDRGIGGDFIDYERYYYNLKSLPDGYYEFGYFYINKFFSTLLNLDFHYFLFIYTSLYLIVLFKSFPKDSYPIMMVMLFLSNYLLVSMVNNRQIFSMSLCFLSVKYLIDNKKLFYLLCLILAVMFHRSALIFISSYFLFGSHIRIKSLILCILFILLYFSLPYLTNLISLLPSIYEGKLLSYAYTFKDRPAFYIDDPYLTFLIFFKRIFILGFIYYFLKDIKLESVIIYKRLYLMSFIFLLLFYSIVPIIAIRGAVYFQMFEVILLPLVIKFNPKKKFTLSLFVIAYSIQNIISSVNDLHGNYTFWNFVS